MLSSPPRLNRSPADRTVFCRLHSSAARMGVARLTAPARTWEHGTTTGYCYHRCRCDECRAVWNEYCRALAEKRRREAGARRLEEYLDSVRKPCGTVAAYARGCRCDDCRRASRDQRRAMRIKARLRAGRQYNTRADGTPVYRDWVVDYRKGRTA